MTLNQPSRRASERTRLRIPSRTIRNAASRSSSVPRASAGSAKFQRSRIPERGGIGHWASQTVTTMSQPSPTSSTDLLRWPLMSTPTSRMTCTARGCRSAATVPALSTSNRSPATSRRNPSAICDRAALCAHRKRTRRLAPPGAPAARPLSAVKPLREREDVQEGPRVGARVEDLGTGVEDKDKDDEDQQDDPDDHPSAEPAVIRHDRPTSGRIDVDLAHLQTSSC